MKRRSLLTDFRHALEEWEKLVKQNAKLSRENVAELDAVKPLALTADRADAKAHTAMRLSRGRSLEMTMMFAPRTGLRQPVEDMREAFHSLREDLGEIGRGMDVTRPEPPVDRHKFWEQVEGDREARRAAEKQLTDRVHPALWSWRDRRFRQAN